MAVKFQEAHMTHDIERLAPMIGAAYSRYHTTQANFRESFRRHKAWRSFILTEGEEVLSHVGIVAFQIRMGTASLDCAGLAWVGTDTRFVRKGLASGLIARVLDMLKSEGRHVAMLFGIRDFYDQFGFATCIPNYDQSIQADRLTDLKAHDRVRSLSPKDLPALKRLYAHHMAGRNASAIRTAKRWDVLLARNPSILVSHLARDPKPTGYLAYEIEDEEVSVREAACLSHGAAVALLARLGALALEHRACHVKMNLPPDDPFSEIAFDEGSSCTVGIQKNGGGMMKILCVPACLDALIPEFESRILDSPYGGKRLTWAVCTPGVERAYRWSGHRLSTGPAIRGDWTLHLSQEDLVRLITGFKSARQLIRSGQATASRGSHALWSILFPAAYPHLCPADRF